MQNSKFLTVWTSQYLFAEVKGKAVYLEYGDKDNTFNYQYETKHTDKCKNLTSAERTCTSEALLTQLQK